MTSCLTYKFFKIDLKKSEMYSLLLNKEQNYIFIKILKRLYIPQNTLLEDEQRDCCPDQHKNDRPTDLHHAFAQLA